MVMRKMVDIFFNEELHKYTDGDSNPYISVTTILHKYVTPFDTNYHAKRVAQRRGVDVSLVLAEWADINKKACEKGSKVHNSLENSINDANGYVKIEGKSDEYVRLYTVSDIIKNHDYGKLDYSKFQNTIMAQKYPIIKEGVEKLCKQGYSIYAEIVVYDVRSFICGMIDVLLVNWETHDFIILDWKTNNKPLMFESGYFRRDAFGYWADFVPNSNMMKYPFNKYPDAVGYHYTMQLSLYAYLLEQFGLKCKALRLCHIYSNKKTELEEINFYKIDYKKIEIAKMVRNRISEIKKC
jgi:hypothetical protein